MTDMAFAQRTNEKLLAPCLNEFAWDLYRSIDGGVMDNIFLSPYSVAAALAMTFAGAKNSTATQMSTVMNFDKIDDVHQAFRSLNEEVLSPEASYTLESANRLYAQQGYSFLDSFMQTTEESYHASLCSVDFKTATEKVRGAINGWVSEQTSGKIIDLIQPGTIDDLTVLVLVNAIYFKGAWQAAFKKADTYKLPFKVTTKETVTVDMMFQTQSFHYHEDKKRKCQILSLPYRGESVRMLIILPKNHGKLPKLENTVSHETTASWIQESVRRKVHVHFPRFKLESSFVLNEQLSKLGMRDLFDEARADLSGITGSTDLVVSQVVHKAFIEVNEEGTEAAAATAVMKKMKGRGLSRPKPPVIPTFKADHPFLFLIYHLESGTIIFLGKMRRPPESLT